MIDLASRLKFVSDPECADCACFVVGLMPGVLAVRCVECSFEVHVEKSFLAEVVKDAYRAREST